MSEAPDTFTKDRMRWLDAIGAHPDLDAAAFKLAYLISGLVNRKTGDAWPSLDYLASAMGMNERSVRRLTDALVSRGFLSKSRGGDGRPNRYRMMLSDRTPMSTLSDDRPDTNVHFEISDRTSTSLRPDIHVRQTGHPCPPISLSISLNDLSEKNILVKAPPKPDLENEFEDLWSHYPKKRSKGRALKAFKAARKRVSLETISAGLMRYAAEREGQDPKYTKHLASWLNDECWNDEPAAPRPLASEGGGSGSWQSGKDRTRAALRIVREGSV